MIPLFKVMMNGQAGPAVDAVLHSGYIGEGRAVARFESFCSDFLHNNNVVALNSCTSAIELALHMCGIGPGDAVISTPLTCLATNEPILHTGARILWADIEPETGNVSVESVRELLGNECVSAIVVVHWAGYPCDMQPLRKLALEYGVPIIEDAAHAWGSTYHGMPIGDKDSQYACFSFQAIKHLTTGDGGLLTTRDSTYDRARLLRWFGLDRRSATSLRCLQDPPEPGFKYHMNDIAATIGLANFELAIQNICRTRYNAIQYNQAFSDLSTVTLPSYKSDRLSSYWLYPLLVDDQQAFIDYLKDRGIEASIVHARNDIKSMFSDSAVKLPGVDYFASHQVNIPVGWWLTQEEVSNIIDTVRSYDNGNIDSV